jgi:radical SAM superfamily enzyme YgiQ (UPF0313 family)
VRVKLILPALTEATSPWWRPIKYSLFPPLGLAILAGYLANDDDAEIQDEHVERLNLEDAPDLVVIQVYITSAYRSYKIAEHYRRRGAYVVMGGLHVTSLPEEAAAHADTIFLGPGEDTWPRFLTDFRRGCPDRIYRSQTRTLAGVRVRRGVEEIRTVVGRGDSRQARRHDAAGAGDDPQRVRATLLTAATEVDSRYRTRDQLPDICPRRHVPSICACAVRCSICSSVSMLESLMFACHVPVIGGDPAGADARSADHEPRQTARCFSAAHVPCSRTRVPSMSVHDPCARLGELGFSVAVQVP